ncbi:hypothetical protein C1752_03427 [Acaryochloris thomasi RCC1774]|uniref:DUF4363 domain-containing protein n=1 Tax=Acaryochloris thomasi RCC1774 TaxID=1764569 RepID=A0A2W1JUW3_9CYAN|nr:hypothetical protein [Acaryochloris thomasi]PZD72591.1 hypothetical protein C1752_03427 [Acaryochloris thomasi RCC1774]
MRNISSKLILLGAVCLISACDATEQVSSKVQDAAQNIGGTQELVGMTKGVTQTLNSVKSGNFDQAKQEFSAVQQNWTEAEGKLKASPETLNNIKSNVQAIATDLKASPPDKDKLLGNLQSLSGSVGALAKGEDPAQTASAPGETSENGETAIGGAELPQTKAEEAQAFENNLVAMKEALTQTNTAVESSDFSSAKDSFGEARQTWYKFGGSVKEKSADTYQAMDQGVKTVNTALNQAEPAQASILSDLSSLSSELDTVAPSE